MDSFVAIKIRSWLKQTFGFEVKVLEMMGMRTHEALLGQHAAEGLQKRLLLKAKKVVARTKFSCKRSLFFVL